MNGINRRATFDTAATHLRSINNDSTIGIALLPFVRAEQPSTMSIAVCGTEDLLGIQKKLFILVVMSDRIVKKIITE